MTEPIILHRLYKSLEYIGWNIRTRKYNAKTALYCFVVGALAIYSTLHSIVERNTNRRLIAMKGGLLYWFAALHFFAMVLISDTLLLLKTIVNGHHELPYPASPERRKLFGSIYSGVIKTNKIWFMTSVLCAIGGLGFPLIHLAFALLSTKVEEIDVTKLFLLNSFWFPNGYDTVPFFIVAYLLESVFLINGIFYGYYTVNAPMAAMQVIGGELKLLRLSIEEMDETVALFFRTMSTKSVNTFNVHKDTELNDHFKRALKAFIRSFVNHHESVYRKVMDVNKGIQSFALIANVIVSLYICLSMYYAAVNKMDDKMSQVQNVLLAYMTAGELFVYDYLGQYITTEDENLRNAIYHSNWINKPEWFKNSLKVIMIRQNSPIIMRAGGFFNLNLKHIATCVNASYSYYNLVMNFK